MNIDKIFPDNEIITIAEIGINHNGDFETAARFIESAAEAGVSAVKFQSFIPEQLYSVYTKSLLENGEEIFQNLEIIDFFNKFCLADDELIKLKEIAEKHNLVFFSAPFDIYSVDLLTRIGVKLFKVASSEVTNILLLEEISKTGLPVLLSTGMCYEDEIENAIDILEKGGCEVILLHCVSLYPLELEDVNLRRMTALRDKFKKEVGFSDHTPDCTAAEIAVHMGARVIEKHFKLPEPFECPDGNVSITSEEFKAFIEKINNFRLISGKGNISLENKKEKDVAKSARKSLFAKKLIKKGTIVSREHFVGKRPGMGIPVSDIDQLSGKIATMDIPEDFLIRFDQFE